MMKTIGFIPFGKRTPSDLCYGRKPNKSGGDELPSADRLNAFACLLYYHLVLVTKCRRKVLNDKVSDY
ncbi:hypothetical protein [Bacillus sp. EB600]|uniref:hypothetical protein n=1 Tax=Bacillus sp. EB600 TaxID=2806345 RepID=UPI0035C0582A